GRRRPMELREVPARTGRYRRCPVPPGDRAERSCRRRSRGGAAQSGLTGVAVPNSDALLCDGLGAQFDLGSFPQLPESPVQFWTQLLAPTRSGGDLAEYDAVHLFIEVDA